MRITEIEIDDGNEAHVTRHGVSLAEIQQVFSRNPEIRRNRKNRASTHVALGTTSGAGACSSRSSTKVPAESGR
ncbi:MAG: hypothetical protein ACR2G2_11815 [Pseudonocardia sp.]